ncbi:hypothetical protein MVEG_10373 [Podila verticillata NRRL 6337]|nr:hypothetical protein MVEG_10373 [Podila verticillata NRRL 6337]
MHHHLSNHNPLSSEHYSQQQQQQQQQHQHQHQRQQTPTPATRSSTPSQTMSPTPAPQSTAAPEGYQGTLKASSFWVQEGMATFFDWITNPHNHERLYKKNPISGQKQKDICREIANVVNYKHNTNWSEGQVKSKIAYVKAKYREAAVLSSTGQEAQVFTRQLEICPEFARLYYVYGGNLSANPPSPKQMQMADFGGGHTVTEITDDESSELEEAYTDTHTDSQSEPVTKRRRENGVSAPAVFATFIERVQQLSDRHRLSYHETRTELRQREQAVEIRERDLMERLFRIAEEARERFRQELATERAEFKRELAELKKEKAEERAEHKKEMAEEKAELKKQMAEERVELKKEKIEFAMERDQLKMENASLRRELEVRLGRLPSTNK